MIGDGISGAFLARDLLKSCGDIAGGGSGEMPALPVPKTIESHMPTGFQGFRGRWAGIKEYRRMRREIRRLGVRPAHVRVEEDAPVGQRKTRIVPLRIPSSRTEALLDAARANRTTLHGLLGATLCLALQPEFDGSVVTFASPVNMRNRMEPPVGEDICLFVSMVNSQHRVDEDTDLWALARDIRGRAVEQMERGAPFSFLTLMNSITARRWFFPFTEKGIARHARFALKHIASQGTAGITNIGQLDIESTLGPLQIEAVHFVVSPSLLGYFVLTAASLQGTLCLDFIHCEPLVSHERTQAIAGRFEKLLLHSSE